MTYRQRALVEAAIFGVVCGAVAWVVMDGIRNGFWRALARIDDVILP